MKKKVKKLVSGLLVFTLIFTILAQIMPVSTYAAGEAPAATYNGHTYQVFYFAPFGWAEAKEYCEQLGGHLAVITSEEENNFVAQMIAPLGKINYWIGATDELVEGTWKWVTGETWDYTIWDSRMPDNSRAVSDEGEDYAYITNLPNPKVSGSKAFTWGDINAAGNYPNEGGYFSTINFGFVCEWEGDNTASTDTDHVWLDTLPVYDTDHYAENQGDSCVRPWLEDYQDINGETYEHGLLYVIARWNYRSEISWAYNDYLLNKQYNTFTGNIVIADIDSWGHNKSPKTTMNVYGDGKLIYSSSSITVQSTPIPFTINVQGVNVLRVEIKDFEATTGGTYFGVTNPVLNKSSENKNSIKVILNGNKLVFDQPPVLENGRMLVPLRTIFEAMGATVGWDNTTQTATGKTSTKEVILKIGSDKTTINGKPYYIDVPAKILNGRTLVPLRFVAESLGAYVEWNGNTNTATIHHNTDADLISRVKAYTTDIPVTYSNNINSKEFKGYMNAGLNLVEVTAYNTLTNSDMYVGYQFQNYLRNNPSTRITLGMGKIVFNGDAESVISGQWPEKERYKTMLKNYINDTHDSFETIAGANEACSFIDEIVKAASNDETKKEIAGVGADAIRKLIDNRRILATEPSLSGKGLEKVLDDIEEQYKVLAKSSTRLEHLKFASKISDILGNVGYVLDITSASIEAYEDLLFIYQNASAYKEYAHVFELIEAKSEIGPLTEAARELKAEMNSKLLAIQNETRKLFQTTAVSTAGYMEISMINLIGNTAAKTVLSSITSGMAIGSFLSNVALGIHDMIDASVYTEGYAYMAELFKSELSSDKQIFVTNYSKSYTNILASAEKFRLDYETLRLIRMAGEKAYLSMRSFDSALLNDILKDLTDFEKTDDFCRESINNLLNIAFK